MSKEISEAMEIHQFMNERNVIMSFMGELTHQLTTSLLKNLREDMVASKIDIVKQKRLYGIIVECLDNIAKHWVAIDIKKILGRASPPIFMLSRKEKHYYITTGNHIPNSQKEMIAEKIEKVNSLSKKALQEFYRKILSKSAHSPSDNAGLGIIDIALKSGNKLEYDFKPVSQDVSFYVIQAKISI